MNRDTPRRTPRLAVCVAALVAGSAALSCTAPVASDLDDATATRIVAALSGSGIASEKAEQAGTGKFEVDVPRADSARSATVLADEGLLAERSRGVLEALGEPGLVPSRTAEHERLVAGIAGDLERTLSSVDGVLSARVHLAVPRADPLASAEPPQPSGAVLLRYRAKAPPLSETDVRHLVAAAVPGLAEARIAVVVVAAPLPDARADVVRIGPVSVSREDASKVRVAVAVVAVVHLALVGCLVAIWLRVRKLRPRGGPPLAPAREPR